MRRGDAYVLRLAGEDGASVEFTATFEQLDTLAEDIDRLLDADDDEESD